MNNIASTRLSLFFRFRNQTNSHFKAFLFIDRELACPMRSFLSFIKQRHIHFRVIGKLIRVACKIFLGIAQHPLELLAIRIEYNRIVIFFQPFLGTVHCKDNTGRNHFIENSLSYSVGIHITVERKKETLQKGSGICCGIRKVNRTPYNYGISFKGFL